VELTKHVGEWVQGGDPLMKLVRFDKLRVQGSVNAKDYLPSELLGRPANISVATAHGKKETFTGRIGLASPIVTAAGDYQVRAEIENRQENGVWVFRPGLQAKMTIQLK
jgi:hypothetical protein